MQKRPFENKKGQIAIWIILAIIIVAVIVVFVFALNKRDVEIPGGGVQEFSVEAYLSNCIGGEVKKASKQMLPQGGFISPTDYRLYNRTSVEFICETKGYFEPCINQHPVFINEMENEILEFITPGVGNCLSDLEYEMKRRGEILIDRSNVNVNVELEFNKVVVTVNTRIDTNEREIKKSYDQISFVVDSAIYNLGIVAMEIASQEASFCYFETVGYSLANPRFKVVRKILSDQSKIYIITDKLHQETMQAAVRSCALPEGMPG